MLAGARPAPGPALHVAVVGLAGLIAVGLAQLADLLTFVRMVGRVGLDAELNPLVSRAAAMHGLEVLAAAKLGLTLFVVVAVVVAARTHPRVAATVLTVGTVAGLIGAASNVFALL
jgi:hypothetical protein